MIRSDKQKDVGEGYIYTITNYIYWVLVGSVYFLLCNLFLILSIVSVVASKIQFKEVSGASILLLLISALPLAPALTALMSTMGRVVREKDVRISSQFFNSYKKNFKQSIAIGTVIIFIVGILIVDFKFFSSRADNLLLVPIMIIITFILINMSIYIFSIMSRFYYKTFDLIKLAFYYTITKIKITVLNTIILIAALILTLQIFNLVIIFLPALVVYLIMYNEKNLFQHIENKIQDDINIEKIQGYREV